MYFHLPDDGFSQTKPKRVASNQLILYRLTVRISSTLIFYLFNGTVSTFASLER